MGVAMGLLACAVEHTWANPFQLRIPHLITDCHFKGIVSKPDIAVSITLAYKKWRIDVDRLDLSVFEGKL